jgi:hypothetical protein
MNTDRLFDEVSLVRRFTNQQACDWEVMLSAVKKKVCQNTEEYQLRKFRMLG